MIPNSDNDLDDSLLGTSNNANPRRHRKRKRSSVQEAIASDPWCLGEKALAVSSFTGVSELKKPLPENELGFLRLFITEFLVKFLTQESNRYARKIMSETEFSSYELISVVEMNRFICILIYMGIDDKPTFEHYWKKKDNPFYNDFCSKLLTFERFKTIKKVFHVFDNYVYNDLESQNVSFSKLDGLIEYFNKKFAEVYSPERDLAVDENMCPWSGRGGSKVYMPLKPVKYGIKSYALCESKTGYACALIQYNSRKPETNLNMLVRLTKNYQNKFHHLYMDNFYTSVKVIEAMAEKGIYCCGTLRDNRGGPKDIKKIVKRFKKGEGLVYTNDLINCIGLMDNGPVAILTNIHSSIVANTSGDEDEGNLSKSNVVKDYNSYMGGVDLMDQMTGYYGINRRSKKWTTKFCFHILNIAIHNSYVLYKKFSSGTQKKTYLHYLIKLIYELGENIVADFPEEDHVCTPQNQQDHSFNGDDRTILHFPIKIVKRKQCVVCKSYSKRTEIKTGCSKCLVPLCLLNCFEEYHNGPRE